ncbi:MAG: hypothetical protein FH751_04070 [Firmicutes bacterium]|nr:hypothetical protein [Bacillota bacterium]
MDSNKKDLETLKVLLVHWVNHNKSHQEKFDEWVEKSSELGKEEVSEYIKKASEYIDKANEMLMEAKKNM